MGQANKNKNIPKSNSSNSSKNVSTKCDYFGVTKYVLYTFEFIQYLRIRITSSTLQMINKMPYVHRYITCSLD